MAKKPGNLAAMKQPRRQDRRCRCRACWHSRRSAAAPKKPFNPVQFSREVRAEARKITWTSRKETWITSVMVFIMVVIAALFFFVVDWLLSAGVAMLLKLANAG